LKNGVWPIGYFPLAISLLVAFTSTNISITAPINAYYTRNVQNPSCWCIQAGKCYGLVSFGGDVDHATIGFNQYTELLSATVSLLFYVILNIRLNQIPEQS